MRELQNQKLFKEMVFSLKIILTQSYICGLTTFSFSEKTFYPSNLRSFINVLTIFLYSSLICYSAYKLTTLETSRMIYVITDFVLILNCGVYMTIIWIFSIIKRDKIIEILLTIIDFDTQLSKDGITINYEKTRKRNIIQIIIRITFLVISISTMVFLSLQETERYEKFSKSTGYFLLIINSAFCHLISELVLMIKSRFIILNKEINNMIKNNHSMKKNDSEQDKQFARLTKICFMHQHLSKLIKLFNETFGVILLSKFAASFVIIVITFFYSTGALQATKIKWLSVTEPFIGSMNIIIDTIHICRVCYVTIQEANKAGKLVHKIESDNYDVRDVTEMFLLQIANQQVEFTAAGFFPINYTLLFSIIGGVTTYIIILIQLVATLTN